MTAAALATYLVRILESDDVRSFCALGLLFCVCCTRGTKEESIDG